MGGARRGPALELLIIRTRICIQVVDIQLRIKTDELMRSDADEDDEGFCF